MRRLEYFFKIYIHFFYVPPLVSKIGTDSTIRTPAEPMGLSVILEGGWIEQPFKKIDPLKQHRFDNGNEQPRGKPRGIDKV
jgi:hypothetical protein